MEMLYEVIYFNEVLIKAITIINTIITTIISLYIDLYVINANTSLDCVKRE